MKKYIGIVLAALLTFALVALAGCGKKTAGSDFVVGFDAEYPPYGFIDTTGEFGTPGAYVGFDLELAALVAEEAGWTFRAEPIDWDAKDQLLESGQITCIWNGFTYENREDSYQWSARYMLNAQVIVVKAGSGIKTLADLAGKTVYTQAESTAYYLITGEDYADANATFATGSVQTVPTYDNAFMQLEIGACDAVICDLSYFNYQEAAKPGAFANIQTLSSEHYAVGFAKDNKDAAAMIAEINKALKELDEKGKVRELCDKYGIDYGDWCL